MSAVNGHAKSSETTVAPTAMLNAIAPVQFPPKKITILVAELEIPFDPSVIEWRVTNTSKDKARGQIIPYADQRAYTDRLNTLFTPAGWTRRYTVHTSSNFQRSKDQRTVAKVFVTCDLTIFGIGSHSATGEEWTDDDNAGTSAEAQAFKRACSCFGLGRYLYYFTGAWVDLDQNKRLKAKPQLAGWATPKGWREGLRPNQVAFPNNGENSSRKNQALGTSNIKTKTQASSSLIHEIEQMRESLGGYMYRGLLRLEKAWKPEQIQDAASRRKTLERMHAAARGLQRLQAALTRVNEQRLPAILSALKIRSIERVDNLETLHKLVLELETAASSGH
jgi:hypothetical protein